MRLLNQRLCAAARWLVVTVVLGGILWLPFHLLTVAHCDENSTHLRMHAQAGGADHHGHSHDGEDAHPHGSAPEHRHFTGDHGIQNLAKRQAFLCTPVLGTVLLVELTQPVAVLRAVVPCSEAAPPPADFSPPSGPRAPPLA